MIEELKAHEDFRQQVREWLARNLPKDWQTEMLGASEDEHVAFQKRWFRQMRDGGYVAPHWPKEWGGGGMSFPQQIVLFEELARAGAPRLVLYFISLYHAPATLLEWGSDEQRKRHLPAILTGDEIWCQGFSEPGAGSDLASLRTKAERRGDVYVINGQKTWSSNAYRARYCLLLARTDSSAPKHKGISYFILDLESKGVTRRPIRMLTGGSHFCELFLDNVEIPAENRVGEEGQGWAVAQSTLASERGLTALEFAERMRQALALLVRDASKPAPWGGRFIDDDGIRRQLVDVHIGTETLHVLVGNMLTRALRGDGGGSEASIIKIYHSEMLQKFTDLGVQLGGISAQYVQSVLMGGGYESGYWMHDNLYSWACTIAGGSNEIQRNIIAEKTLGLPREPKLAVGP
ncbi:acyl-CoA dehydrogenase family protein [Steroidobacter flavus]|uniref:Acyl-CoA dehydrogenase family protein n=1 Tax=Steroidobacter flavus TaxID=1842136 RepID=A0ABV8T1X6_9GAMM